MVGINVPPPPADGLRGSKAGGNVLCPSPTTLPLDPIVERYFRGSPESLANPAVKALVSIKLHFARDIARASLEAYEALLKHMG